MKNRTPADSIPICVNGTNSTPRVNEETVKKQPKQRKSWFFTYNNYEEKDPQILCEKFNEICEKFIFQKEKGNGVFSNVDDDIEIKIIEGTKHLQGVIFLKNKMRPSEFKLSNKIHWEGTRNKKASIDYCQKKETSQGEIFFKGFVLNRDKVKTIKDLYKWQEEIYNIIKEEPNDRNIIWLYNNDGNIGKSQLVKKIAIEENESTCILSNATTDNINYNIYSFLKDENGKDKERTLKTVLFDLPRCSKIKDINLEAVENIKNGLIVNNKYKGGSCAFNSPHIIFFTNYEPNENLINKLSLDRWNIGEIIDKDNNIVWKKTKDFLTLPFIE